VNIILELLISDLYFCATASTFAKTLAVAPVIETVPSIEQVSEGQRGVIVANVTGVPPPTIHWYVLTNIQLNSSIIAGRRDAFRDQFANNVEEDFDFYIVGPDIQLHPDIKPDYLRRQIIYQPSCNVTAGFTTDCSIWLLTSQVTDTFITPVVTSSYDGTMIQFIASNFLGSVTSSPIMIQVVPAQGEGSNVDTSIIVGVVVGVGGGACLLLLCCLLLILVLLILRNRRNSGDEFPGIPPNYEEVIFGPMLEPMFKAKKHKDNLRLLEQLLLAEGSYLAFAMLDSDPKEEEVVKALIVFLVQHKKVDPLLRAVISNEVAGFQSTAKTTMFRTNTLASRMFKHFALLVGAEYIWTVLAPFVWEIQKNAHKENPQEEDMELDTIKTYSSSSRSNTRNFKMRTHIGMEVDPMKMDEAADPKVNNLHLQLTAQRIFSAIARSRDDLPCELRDILCFVYEEIESSLGEGYVGLGGFFFLRFLCPTLIAPHMFGLAEVPPTPTAQRQLILIGKLLQNLANNTLPGSKEAYMEKLNEFITNNQDELRKFFDDILDDSRGLQSAKVDVPDIAIQNALCIIHNFLASKQATVKTNLASYVDQSDKMFEELDHIVKSGPIPKSD